MVVDVKNVIAKFTGKHLCQRLYFNKAEIDSDRNFFSASFENFLKTPFLQKTCRKCFLRNLE